MNKRLLYQIAGIPITLRGEERHLFRDDGILAGFRRSPGEPGAEYELCVRDSLDPVAGTLCYSEESFCVYRSGGMWITCFGGGTADQPGIYATTHRTQQGSRITYRRTEYLQRISPKQALRCMELPHQLAIHSGILLHCAWIRWRGQAILFTAPSGTGKSTQARLWCEHMGAELINGDRGAIRVRDGAVLACGIPMSGSSDVRKNEHMPLRAIVYLSQAPGNQIRQLRGAGAFRRVWEGCTVPVWDREDVMHMTETVGRILEKVPVYHLSCTPDQRAVQLLRDTLEVI